MKKTTYGGFTLPVWILVCGLLFTACSKKNDSPADPCAGKTIVVTATLANATPGLSNGSIVASASGSSGFTYSINNGAFQASGTFASLAAGSYNITAKDGDNCTGSNNFTIATADACAGKNILVSGAATGSDLCSASGSITITATGGTGFSYSLNNGSFQPSNIFNNIATGNYTLNAKDADGCVKTATAVVADLPAGVSFAAVRTIMQTNCAKSGCHTGAAAQSGINYSIDCTIVSNWERIKARAVDANPSVMPPAPNAALSAADKQKILDWIAAGHKYTN